MKYLMFICAMTVLINCGGKDQVPASKQVAPAVAQETTAAAEKGERLIYYTCPMPEHKHVHSMEPGNCPECGMQLVPAVVTTPEQAEFYGCPMEIHSHVRQAGPGRCPECKMKLEPMRLVKPS